MFGEIFFGFQYFKNVCKHKFRARPLLLIQLNLVISNSSCSREGRDLKLWPGFINFHFNFINRHQNIKTEELRQILKIFLKERF